MLPVEILEPNGKSCSQKISKGQSRDNYIMLLSNLKYKRYWIDAIFLQDKHNIKECLKI